MKVTLIDSMGTDLSVVNAARVSFGKQSEWEYYDKEDGGKVYADQIGSVYPWYDKRLSDRDTKLIQFLARGCTSGDWEDTLEEIFEKGVRSAFDDFAIYPVTEEEGEENYREMEELVKQIKRMPTHWTPFGHTAITLHIKAPIFVARQLG